MHFVLLGSSSSSSALATRSGSSEETLNKTSIQALSADPAQLAPFAFSSRLVVQSEATLMNEEPIRSAILRA